MRPNLNRRLSNRLLSCLIERLIQDSRPVFASRVAETQRRLPPCGAREATPIVVDAPLPGDVVSMWNVANKERLRRLGRGEFLMRLQ